VRISDQHRYDGNRRVTDEFLASDLPRIRRLPQNTEDEIHVCRLASILRRPPETFLWAAAPGSGPAEAASAVRSLSLLHELPHASHASFELFAGESAVTVGVETVEGSRGQRPAFRSLTLRPPPIGAFARPLLTHAFRAAEAFPAPSSLRHRPQSLSAGRDLLGAECTVAIGVDRGKGLGQPGGAGLYELVAAHPAVAVGVGLLDHVGGGAIERRLGEGGSRQTASEDDEQRAKGRGHGRFSEG
jgi:hypothetical protein